MARSGGGSDGSLDCIRSVENAMAWLFGGVVVVARTTTDEMQLTNFMMGAMMTSEDQSDEERLET